MHNVTRRSFLELAAGTLASLPVLAGGLVLAPSTAYAAGDSTDANELVGKESEYVVIDVVQPWEVGFIVVDVTKAVVNDDGMVTYPKEAYVAGAHIAVTSRFNNKIAEGITDASGVVNIDIRDLAVHTDDQDVNDLDDYYFNGSVTITCDGFREFKTALLAIEGGDGLLVPNHPLDGDDAPYPHLVAFDEWDALYWQNDFLVTPQNTDDHTVAVEVWNLPVEGSAQVQLWVVGEKAARQSADSGQGSGRTATASFTAPFLKEGDAACLPAGSQLELRVTQGATTWSWNLAATFSKAVVDEPAGKERQTLKPINERGAGSGMDIKWPSGVPLLGGAGTTPWMPALPIDIYVNPFGFAQISLTVPLWGYRNDKGDEQPHGWGRYPRKSVKDQWDLKVKTLKKMSEKTNNAVAQKGAVQQIDLFKSISMDINFMLLALAQWDSKKGIFQGEAGGQIVAAVNFAITENFMAGPIPVLITFALDASFTFGLFAAAYSAKEKKGESLLDAACDFSRWQWDYQNTGFSMTLSLTPSLSVGVGIRGIASISVKGAITLSLFLGVPMGTQPDGLPNPHITAGWSAQILLVIEMFLFTQSFSLYNKQFSNFHDNWEGKKALAAQAEDGASDTPATISIEEMLNNLQPITDAMLEQHAEASMSAASALSAQGVTTEAAPLDWDKAYREEQVTLPDGTVTTQHVWDFSVSHTVERPDDEATEATETDGPEDEAPRATEEEAPRATEDEASRATEDEASVLVESAPIEDETFADTEGKIPALGEPVPLVDEASPVAEDGASELDEPALLLDEASLVTEDETSAFIEPPLIAEGGASEPDEPAPIEGEPSLVTEDSPIAPDEPALLEDETSANTGDASPEEATTPALWAQADVPAPNVEWRSSMADFDPHSDLGVAGLGVAGGIRPSKDLRIFGTDDRHVLGAPKMKAISLGVNKVTGENGGVWVFRLASIEVEGNMRTRVVASCIDGPRSGTSRVIEFDTRAAGAEVDHRDLYDYDFDVAGGYDYQGREGPDEGGYRSCFCLHLVVVSGQRPSDGQSTTIAAAATDLVFTNLLYVDGLEFQNVNVDSAGESWIKNARDLYGGHAFFDSSQMPLATSRVGDKVIGKDADKFHSVASVQIQWRSLAEGGVFSPLYTVATFLDRCADTQLATLGEGATVRLGTISHIWGFGLWTGADVIMQDDGIRDVGDTTAYEQMTFLHKVSEIAGADQFAAYLLVMVRGSQKAHYLSMRLSVYWSPQITLNTQAAPLGDYDPSIRMVPFPSQGCCLTSYPTDPAELDKPIKDRDFAKWVLHKADIVTSEWPAPTRHEAHLEFAPFGPSRFSVASFAVCGDFIFWPHTRSADKEHLWDPDGNEVGGKKPAVHQIKACRMRGGKFSDPFVVADLPTDTDALAVLDTNGIAVLEALRAVYVDTGERDAEGNVLYHAADIWYTAVPAALCATATACAVEHPFVTPGGKIHFDVATRNDGNTFLKGCTFKLCALNEGTGAYEYVPGAEAQVTFSKDTLLESPRNPSDGEGGLLRHEDDYALPPGKTSVYAVTVSVPEDWDEGEKKVLFVATDGVLAEGYVLAAQADGESGLAALEAVGQTRDQNAVSYHAEPGDVRVIRHRTQHDQDPDQRHMVTLHVEEAGDSALFQAAPTEVTVEGSPSDGNPSGGGGDSVTAPGGTTPGGATSGSATPDGTASTRRTAIPDTGDDSSSGVLGAGLAALGAAALAYERRRAQNESR